MLFKRSLLPQDDQNVRNEYIKMMDHRSTAIISLCTNLRSEALQEKMTLTKSSVPPDTELSGNNLV